MILPLLVLFGLTMPDPPRDSPEARALGFLAHEVPQWQSKNKCFSCHNNGDAARALYSAMRDRCPIPAGALEGTTGWLVRPGNWDHDRGAPGFSDKGLARIQFASALATAMDAGVVRDRGPLQQAAELVAANQQKDGSWRIGAEGTIGSPATYGACLATYQASSILKKADRYRYRTAIQGAERFLRKAPVENTLDAAAIILALKSADEEDARKQQERSIELIRKGEAAGGGWGPYPNSPPEPFDTAVVILALSDRHDRPTQAMLSRARAYLIKAQSSDGSWPETTRPAGAQSYAQRISTTAWATMALHAGRESERKWRP